MVPLARSGSIRRLLISRWPAFASAEWAMADFDIKALHAALDTERQSRALTRAALAREVTGPEPGGISTSSFSGMGSRSAVSDTPNSL